MVDRNIPYENHDRRHHKIACYPEKKITWVNKLLPVTRKGKPSMRCTKLAIP